MNKEELRAILVNIAVDCLEDHTLMLDLAEMNELTESDFDNMVSMRDEILVEFKELLNKKEETNE